MDRPQQIYLAVKTGLDPYAKWDHIACETIQDAIGTIKSLSKNKIYKVLKELDISTELEMASAMEAHTKTPVKDHG